MHGSAQDEGVCARALRTLLGAAAASGSQRSTHMLLSVLEIHREAIHDLLLPPSTPSPPKLDVRLIGGEGGGGVHVPGLTPRPIESLSYALELLSIAAAARTQARTCARSRQRVAA